MFSLVKRICFIIIIGLACTGLANAAMFQRVVAPQYQIDNLQTVLVLKLESASNSSAVAEVLAARLNGNVGRTSVPAEQTGLQADTKSTVISVSTAPSTQRIVELTASHKAQVAMYGGMSAQRTDHGTYKEDRVRYEGSGDNKRKIEYKVDCARQTVETVVWAKAFTSDGKLLFEERDAKTHRSADCDERGDDKLVLPKAKSFLTGRAGDVANSVYKFAPHWAQFSVPMVDLPSAGSINQALASGRYETGLEDAGAMLKSDPYNVTPIFAAALAYELHGNLDKAAFLYQEGEALNARQAGVFTAGRQRIVRRRDELNAMQAYSGIAPTVGEFESTTPIFARLKEIDTADVQGTPAIRLRS